MSPQPIRESVAGLDLTGRIAYSTTIVASPAAAAETVIANVTVPGDVAIVSGILLVCWVAFTVGTSGVSARLRIKRTDASGTTEADTGVTPATAAALVTRTALGVDASAKAGQVYAATLIIASGAAESTISSLVFAALAI